MTPKRMKVNGCLIALVVSMLSLILVLLVSGSYDASVFHEALARLNPARRDFTARFVGFHRCGKLPIYAEFEIVNTGWLPLGGQVLEIVDLERGITLYGPASNHLPFVEKGECPPGSKGLKPGQTAYIASALTLIPTQHAEARVTMCPPGKLGGSGCVTHTVSFAFPATELEARGIPGEPAAARVAFNRIDHCETGNDICAFFEFENTGSLALHWIKATLEDRKSDLTVFLPISEEMDVWLGTGKSTVQSISIGCMPPASRHVDVVLKICAVYDLCTTYTGSFAIDQQGLAGLGIPEVIPEQGLPSCP